MLFALACCSSPAHLLCLTSIPMNMSRKRQKNEEEVEEEKQEEEEESIEEEA